MMQGQIRYPIEKVGVVIATKVTWFMCRRLRSMRPRFMGDGPSTRLAMNGYPDIAHLRDVVQPH